MNPVVHFEIPMRDKEAQMKFYSEVFGWKIQDMPEMNYVMATTTETDENSMIVKPGRINGGMRERLDVEDSPTLVMAVNDVDEHIAKIEAAGGSKVQGSTAVGDMGFYGLVRDPEGNLLGLWKDNNYDMVE